jgi:hypothetical protein
MRTTFFALLLVLGLVAAPAVTASGSVVAASAVENVQQPDPPPPAQPSARLDIDIDTDRGGAWYTQPIWIAIGVIALIVIVALIAMAGRGGGTTVVRG